MNKKNVTFVLLVTVVLVGLMLWGKNNQAIVSSPQSVQAEAGNSLVSSGQNYSALTLSAPERFYDFGTISMAEGKVSRVFKVNNSTKKDINLESLTTSCMCTAAYIVNGLSKRGPFGMPGHIAVPKANEVIKVGETREIEVVYDPAAHGPAGVGPIDRFVYLVDSAGNNIQLEIKAVVTP